MCNRFAVVGVNMKKNDDIKLDITAMTGEGVGIARYDGMAVFVPQTAVGDTVLAHIIKVKKSYAIAKLLDVILPSKDRTQVDCNVFSKCGGCAFRHISYNAEKKVKYNNVKDAMLRIGGIDKTPNDIISLEQTKAYRNKAQYPISQSDNGISYGFFAKHSHRVIECDNCLLQPKIFGQIMMDIKKWADNFGISAYDEKTKSGILRHVLIRLGEETNQIMVVPVINADELPYATELVEILKARLNDSLYSLQYNVNKVDTNVILGEKTVLVYGKTYITDKICGVELKISANSFYQVNKKAAEVLYSKAASYIENDDRVIIDLFCGIGSIGLSLLSQCCENNRKLYGVEIVEQAVLDANCNSKENGFLNCEFICADATGAAEKLNKQKIKPDVVVVDPPRKGCDAELIETISKGFAPKKLIYISCDPATLARDSKLLCENGYALKEYTPVDLFPKTAHVETVALFEKNNI